MRWTTLLCFVSWNLQHNVTVYLVCFRNKWKWLRPLPSSNNSAWISGSRMVNAWCVVYWICPCLSDALRCCQRTVSCQCCSCTFCYCSWCNCLVLDKSIYSSRFFYLFYHVIGGLVLLSFACVRYQRFCVSSISCYSLATVGENIMFSGGIG